MDSEPVTAQPERAFSSHQLKYTSKHVIQGCRYNVSQTLFQLLSPTVFGRFTRDPESRGKSLFLWWLPLSYLRFMSTWSLEVWLLKAESPCPSCSGAPVTFTFRSLARPRALLGAGHGSQLLSRLNSLQTFLLSGMSLLSLCPWDAPSASLFSRTPNTISVTSSRFQNTFEEFWTSSSFFSPPCKSFQDKEIRTTLFPVWNREGGEKIGKLTPVDTSVLYSAINKDCVIKARARCRYPRAGGSFSDKSNMRQAEKKPAWTRASLVKSYLQVP